MPYRVLDTRTGARPAAGDVLVLDVHQLVQAPAGTSAVALNLAVDEPAAAGFITVYPCANGRPLAANANYVRGSTVSKSVTVSLDAAGKVRIYTMSSAHVVIDVNGHYVG